MFEYLEPEPGDNQEINPEIGFLPLPPRSGGNDRETRSLHPEKVRHMLYGSLAGLDRTIKILHALGYADPNDWCDPIPVPPNRDTASDATSLAGIARSPNRVEIWMVIMTKTLRLE